MMKLYSRKRNKIMTWCLRLVIVLTTVIVLAVSSFQISVHPNNEFISFGLSTAQAAPAIGEIISARTLTSKSYYLGNNTYTIGTSLGAIHYKDGLGQWQDIDTEYSIPDTGNFTAQFTKVAYYVRINDDGTRRIYPDRNDLSYWIDIGKPFSNMGNPTKSGSNWTWDFPHATIKIQIQSSAVKFNAILKDAQSPTSITIPFDVQGTTRTGNVLYHNNIPIAELRKPTAIDANLTERDCTTTFNVGSITISLNTTGLVFPINIDPTVGVQVGASADDATRSPTGSFNWSTTTDGIQCGFSDSTAPDLGAGMRFLNITISAGSTITNATMTQVCSVATTLTTVNTRIRAQNSTTPATFSTNTDFDARTWTSASVNWDGIAAWSAGSSYTSPNITAPIQEVINLAGWTSGNNITILWDDFQKRSTQVNNTYRRGTSYDGSTSNAPTLNITYTAASPPSLTNSPSSKAFGILQAATTYWSNGSAPVISSSSNITYNATNNIGTNWTNPSYANADNGGQAANITSGSPSGTNIWGNYSATTTGTVSQVRVIADAWSKDLNASANNTNNATANNGTAWANPPGAYLPDGTGNVTSIISGSPSGTNIWKTFGFANRTPTSVRLLVDASSGIVTVASANVSPTANTSVNGSWSYNGSGYSDAAQYLSDSTSNNTFVQLNTNGGGSMAFSFPSFNISSTATNITLHVQIQGSSATTLTNNNLRPSINISNIPVAVTMYWDAGRAGSSNASAPFWYTANWTTNPDTGANWTVGQINGTENRDLVAIGIGSSDANPHVRFYSLRAWVTYDTGEDLYAEVSKDAGITWNATTFNLTGTNTTYSWNITGMSWNATTMQNGNPCVRLSAITVGLSGNVTVSWLRLEVLSGGVDNEQLKLEVTNNGGSSWNTTTINLNGTETRYYWDVTAGITWNATTLNNTNLQVRASAITVGDTGNVSLDWLAVEVVTAADVLDNAECYFTITNNGSVSINISVNSTPFTGGVGWTLGTPATDVVRLSVLKSGDTGYSSNITLNATGQAWISNLATNTTIKWELRLDSPTSFTDGVQKTATITLTAVQS